MSTPNADSVRHAVCRHCAQPISQEAEHGAWQHDANGKIKCRGILGGEYAARPTRQYEAAQIDGSGSVTR